MVVIVGGLTEEVEGQIKSKLKVKEVYGLEIVKDIPGQLVGLVRVGAKSAIPLPYSEVLY